MVSKNARSRLALAITLWGWLLFMVWLSYDYAEYKSRWVIHIFQPVHEYEIHSFHVLIFLIPFLYTFLGYLVHEREKLLKKVQESEEKFRMLSLHDELTGLHNRRGFDFLSEQQLKRAMRTGNGMFVMFVDVDNLKFINDTYGHREGDLALIDTANILKTLIRRSDILARIGGDEFVALIDRTVDNLPEILADRLQQSIHSHNAEGTRNHKLSLSFGFARYNPNDPTALCSVSELLNRSDRKMYENKQKNDHVSISDNNELQFTHKMSYESR